MRASNKHVHTCCPARSTFCLYAYVSFLSFRRVSVNFYFFFFLLSMKNIAIFTSTSTSINNLLICGWLVGWLLLWLFLFSFCINLLHLFSLTLWIFFCCCVLFRLLLAWKQIKFLLFWIVKHNTVVVPVLNAMIPIASINKLSPVCNIKLTIFPRYEKRTRIKYKKKKIIELFRRYFEIDVKYVCTESGCGSVERAHLNRYCNASDELWTSTKKETKIK